MLIAVIDIGSSIIKYKIYEYDNNTIEPVIIHDERKGLITYRKKGKLTDEGLNILLETLKEYKKFSEKLGVDKTCCVATASLRSIDNSSEVLETVKRELDLEIKILSGIEEAKHSFNSIKWIDIPEDEGILVDIGGGSSEVSIFENKTPLEQKSIPMGVLNIYENYVSLLLPTKKEQEEIIRKVRLKIRELNFIETSKTYLYGIGKTIVTLKRLFEHLNIETEENTINIKDIDNILNKLSENTKENFKPLLQVDSERVHTIIPSLLIIKSLALEFKLEKIFVCNVTLQDGIILDILEKNNKE
ncbi:MAG: hypothetical protein BZ138_02480 [Methanosphaera sp. rholeuAM270]|nr:MAG: hypothetical protein BZ138_02480 [Methanosphaera sp. rholeuAM270]